MTNAAGTMMIELKLLRKFLIVAEQGNFTRAAEQLNIAQPALSRQIARLEEDLGVGLIDRQSRPLQLTRAGRFLQKEAAALLEQAGTMESIVRQIGSRATRVLNFGFAPTIAYGGLPDVMSRLEARFKDIDVRWSELKSSELAEYLRKGSIDIGFSRYRYDDEAIVHIRLRDERLFAAFSRGHPLARHDGGTVGIRDLDGFDLITYPGSSKLKGGFADQTLAWFAEFGSRPTDIREVNERDVDLREPFLDRRRDKFTAIVRPDIRRRTACDEQMGKCRQHVLLAEMTRDDQRQACPAGLVDNRQDTELAAIVGATLDKVICPDMPWILRAQPRLPPVTATRRVFRWTG